MNLSRFYRTIVLVLILLPLASCGSRQSPVPTLERLESLLALSFPAGAEVIGGTESSESSSLWVITSTKRLPRPAVSQSRTPRRWKLGDPADGTQFPVSALANLMAATGVTLDAPPKFIDQRGTMHTGQTEQWQFSYREAQTDRGWLTAIEVQSLETSDTQTGTD